jgi:hypothetical protein
LESLTRVRGPGPFAQPWLGPGIGALVGLAPEPSLAAIAAVGVLVAIVGVGGAVGIVLMRAE